MLQISGPDHTPEYQAAQALAHGIQADWPALATHPDHQMTLVAASAVRKGTG